MNLQDTTNRVKTFSMQGIKLSLVFVLLFTLCFAGEAAAASSDLIIVNKKTNTLAFFSGGKLEKSFPVATGKTKSLTPEGSFRIVVKVKNRPYYKEKIPGGDPANPLGDRWLGLEVNGTMGTTYAIHGNNNESSIGKYVSAGCIRMHNKDIHWLYPRVAKNTTVIITSSGLDMEALAAKHGYPLGIKILAGTFIINGQEVKLNDPIAIKDSRVFIPLRESVAALGGTLRQENGTGALVITLGNRTVTHLPLTDQAVVNGTTVPMIASIKANGRLLYPLSSIPGLFGLQVSWNAKTRTVTFTD